MQPQSHEFSYFLNCGKDLESLAEDCFRARPTEVEDDQPYVYGLTAATKLIRKLTPMLTLTFRSVIYLNDRKCRRVSCEFFLSEIKARYLEQLIILRQSEMKCILDRAYIV